MLDKTHNKLANLSNNNLLNMDMIIILVNFFISFNDLRFGLIPPWIAINLLFTIHDKGNESNVSIIISYVSWSYLYRHSSLKLKKLVIYLHSWFPLNKQTVSGKLIFNTNTNYNTSIENWPRSIKSPKNKYFYCVGLPPTSKILIKS